MLVNVEAHNMLTRLSAARAVLRFDLPNREKSVVAGTPVPICIQQFNRDEGFGGVQKRMSKSKPKHYNYSFFLSPQRCVRDSNP